MMNDGTETTARTLVADGKGILAADENPGTLTGRFDALGLEVGAADRGGRWAFDRSRQHLSRQPC